MTLGSIKLDDYASGHCIMIFFSNPFNPGGALEHVASLAASIQRHSPHLLSALNQSGSSPLHIDDTAERHDIIYVHLFCRLLSLGKKTKSVPKSVSYTLWRRHSQDRMQSVSLEVLENDVFFKRSRSHIRPFWKKSEKNHRCSTFDHWKYRIIEMVPR